MPFLLCAMLPGASASAGQAQPKKTNPPNALAVEFGRPHKMQRLLYKKMYGKKPFSDAIIFYYDNGIYKIVSPGEDHYGSYVIDGSFDDPVYTIHFISWPSVDWDHGSAYHVLEFDQRSRAFMQRAIVPKDGRLPFQYGDFATAANPVVHPLQINWEQGEKLIPAP